MVKNMRLLFKRKILQVKFTNALWLRYDKGGKTSDHTDALNTPPHRLAEVPSFVNAQDETRVLQGPVAVVYTLDFSA